MYLELCLQSAMCSLQEAGISKNEMLAYTIKVWKTLKKDGLQKYL
jgi:hypothetical protein